MVHCVDPEGFEAVYSRLYTQDAFADYLDYEPKVDRQKDKKIDWDADVSS